MIDISSWAIAEKNKVSQSNVWIHLVEIGWPQPTATSPFRITSDISNVTWGGYTWEAFPLVIGTINENINEIPQCQIDIGNINGVAESYLLDFSYYTKTTGSYSVPIKIMVVNSGNLAASTPETTHIFEFLSATSDTSMMRITAGVSSPFRRRFPEYRILKNQCRYQRFKGADCAYTGEATSCDRTLANCRQLSNSSRFGGFPGVGDEIYRG